MIAYIRGIIVESVPGKVTIETGGIGYEVFVPAISQEHIPIDEERKLLIYHHVAETDESLYGFLSHEERNIFRLLVENVTGVGPKMAMIILSGVAVADFKGMVAGGHADALAKVKRVGPKTAQRIIIELKDKVGIDEIWAAPSAGRPPTKHPHQEDAELSLVALGHKGKDARALVAAALATGVFADAASLIKAALRRPT